MCAVPGGALRCALCGATACRSCGGAALGRDGAALLRSDWGCSSNRAGHGVPPLLLGWVARRADGMEPVPEMLSARF
eukprot:gene34550-46263_t